MQFGHGFLLILICFLVKFMVQSRIENDAFPHLTTLTPSSKPKTLLLYSHQSPKHSPPLSTNLRFTSVRIHSSLSDGENELNPSPLSPIPINKPLREITDEWGEKSEPEPESSYTKLSYIDPPTNEDEWGGTDAENYRDYNSVSNNGIVALVDDTLGDLKRCLVDTFYDTGLGFKASAEVRADVLELVNQLEALNPTPAPTTATSLLDGNWVLLYKAFDYADGIEVAWNRVKIGDVLQSPENKLSLK